MSDAGLLAAQERVAPEILERAVAAVLKRA
jgi:hypothetical protein